MYQRPIDGLRATPHDFGGASSWFSSAAPTRRPIGHYQ
ncbi:hypothetical protein N181_30495 [Sinorhizobium fredii USDA 205]|nr:hypothetical protein SF83666_b65720 [Sinorhizobium fredii CCBAU 83666]KSV91953.1 hypothetical protein N181_30495 [Sinorhizobium fredii USDA 205]